MIVQESVSRHLELRRTCLAANDQIQALLKEREKLLEEVNLWRASQAPSRPLREPIPPNEALNQELSSIERESFGAFPNGFGYNSPNEGQDEGNEEQDEADSSGLDHSLSDSNGNGNLISMTLADSQIMDFANPGMLADALKQGRLNMLGDGPLQGEASSLGPNFDIHDYPSQNMTLTANNSLIALDRTHGALPNLETTLDEIDDTPHLNDDDGLQDFRDYRGDNSIDFQLSQAYRSSNLAAHHSFSTSPFFYGAYTSSGL